jgi:hypothetical protein
MIIEIWKIPPITNNGILPAHFKAMIIKVRIKIAPIREIQDQKAIVSHDE